MELYFLLGYLASGKTSCLNNMLMISGKKTAVIINDFGDLDVDGELIDSANKISITGGSIFCSCKSHDFAAALKKTLEGGAETIIVEASGLANPFTMLSAAKVGFDLAKKPFVTPKSLCLIDCTNFCKLLPIIHMLKMQVASSDLILLNKSSLVSKNDIIRIREIIKSINGNAKILVTDFGKIDNLNFDIVEKKLPINVSDIVTQKCTVKLLRDLNGNIDENKLLQFCECISKSAHRIKGIVGGNVYEYCDGKLIIRKNLKNSNETSAKQDDFLIILTCLPINLKTQVTMAIKDVELMAEII